MIITDAVVGRNPDLIPLAPLHNPGAVAGIQAARAEFDVPHVAVFDTAFFATLPPAAATYAIPADLARTHRIRRYGFHGTSHRFVSAAAADLVGRPLDELNQIVLHLGNGCSASAVRGGVADRDVDGADPAAGTGHGHPVRRRRPGAAHLPAQRARAVGRRDRQRAQQAVRAEGLAGVNDFRELQQRRESRRQGGAAGLRRLRAPAQALRRRLPRPPRPARRAHLHRRGRREQPGLRAASPRGSTGSGSPSTRPATRRVPRPSSRPTEQVVVAVVPTNEELAIARQTAPLLAAQNDRTLTMMFAPLPRARGGYLCAGRTKGANAVTRPTARGVREARAGRAKGMRMRGRDAEFTGWARSESAEASPRRAYLLTADW